MRWKPGSVLVLAAALIGSASPLRGAEVGKPDPAQVEFFEKSVRPVLATKCLGCHGPEKQKGGLRLDSRSSMMRGGGSGPAIVPGDPEQSRLVEAIRYDSDIQMPPKTKLKDAEISALTEWVRRGAFWPEPGPQTTAAAPDAKQVKITSEDRAFWSFQPIRDHAPPPVKDAGWPRDPLDHFVLSKLEGKGLKPVGPAGKRTLIRRATFDLTGLPPTVEEVDAFLKDESPEAFARVVDRLLASPHYGERWGRHWLDVARYGEDQAHTFQARLYPYGFRYRDWVVKALNDDMPYDRFVKEQIAGDLIEGPGRDGRLAAVGLFALGPVYYGKAVFDELDDRVDTLCRGFLGLTVACARCHDHKFDPVPQRDYYALAGIFASTEYKEYPQAPPEVVARYEQAMAAVKARNDAINALLQAESRRLSESYLAQSARYMVAAWRLANRRKAAPGLPAAGIAQEEKLRTEFLDRWARYLFPEGKGKDNDTRPYLARWRQVLAGQDPAKDLSADPAAKAQVAEAARAFQEYVESVVKLRDAIQAHADALKANAPGNASAGAAGSSAAPALSAQDSQLLDELVARRGVYAIARGQVESMLPAESKATLKAMRAELNRLKKNPPKKYPVIHSLTEGATIADMRVHLRGNPETLGEPAPRHFLSILCPGEPTAFRKGSGRLELAEAIASADNPLTARVMVNRVWEHHFGRGLVGTPSNFGHLGELPTHPELLDHLARRFIAGGWSLKALHRAIMLSATYRLASAYDERNHEIDPDNRLLWRMNRRRLEVEAWRDAMLAVSGSLDRTIGGPSLALTSSDNQRRTLYAVISRHNLDGLLRLFDFPDPNITSDKRVVTAVPLQQLFVLNSDFMERQARALAARLSAAAGATDADRVCRAFLLLYGRPATDPEVEWACEFVQGKDAEREPGAPSRWEQYAQVLLGTNEFLFVD
jgi:cytochrome c553